MNYLLFMGFGLIAVVLLAAMMISAVRGIFAFGQLQGFREAIDQLTRGVSLHYERDGEPLPEDVAKCVDKMKAGVAKGRNAQEKCEAYRVHLQGFGDVMGEAAWQAGF
jgi:hypothetical protein